MEVIKHYQSINSEISALKDRISNVIGHKGAIGEWRESVLRGVLRRYLPPALGVGHGFVMLPDGTSTTQIDVIIYDQNYPRYVQEGEFVIITSDAVRAIIEVKSSTASEPLNKSLKKLAEATKMIREQANLGGSLAHTLVWSGYFALNQTRNVPRGTLGRYIESACSTREDAINSICLGPGRFVRFWNRDQIADLEGEARNLSWMEYNLPQQAYGYFIMNLISRVCNESITNNHGFWFPEQGKGRGTELYKIDEAQRLP